MASAVVGVGDRGFQHGLRRDARLVALAFLHGVILLAWPSAALIAIGLWWNSNTIAHNFIHRPFFRSRRWNMLFSCYLTALLGFPQTLWRSRHLAHHAGVPAGVRISARLLIETAVVCGVWATIAIWNPRFFATTYLSGYLAGLMLCALQGHYEHVGGVISHYGWLYNRLCFNDGFHAEHHANPARHWSELRLRTSPDARASRWPALLRWLEGLNLEALEGLVLRSPRLQAMVLGNHRRAIRALLAGVPAPRRAIVVGGGLFPRSALILRELLPAARIAILDANPRSLDAARSRVPPGVEMTCRRYVPGESLDCDLAVLPLSFDGDRERIYRDPPAPVTLVHDWIWRVHFKKRGRGRIVSVFLLKRVNLIPR